VQIGEFDYAGAIDGEDEYAAADAFRENFLEVAQGDQEPIHYPYAFVAPVNTGVNSGFDLDRDGTNQSPSSSVSGSEGSNECPPEHDTADFSRPGNLRVDYALPSVNLQIEDAGVFWPLVEGPWYPIVDQSDHRMVWVDVRVPTRGR
jgi:hypothetical protein